MTVCRSPTGTIDARGTADAAFAPVATMYGELPILGVFVHQGDHYTAIIRQEGIIYHIDSLPTGSGNGRYVYTVSPALFVEYAMYYRHGHLAPGGREVGGMYSVYYVGHDYLAGNG